MQSQGIGRVEGARKNGKPLPHDQAGITSVGATSFSPGPGAAESDPDPRDWLAAIITGSDDAIISKDLAGNIRSWNAGATRLFGYRAEEVVGRPVTILIPEDRLDEEPRILAEIRKGRLVEHFETMRRRQDGSLIDLSLTISPIRNASGVIVGASKIARDITHRRQTEEAQKLLFREMQHRIKNLFALTAGIVSLSGRSGDNVTDVVRTIHERLTALSRAHDLTMIDLGADGFSERDADLQTLLEIILRPYEGQVRIATENAAPLVKGKAMTNFALLLHELTTNAAKYGALSVPGGVLDVRIIEQDEEIGLIWTETGGPHIVDPRTSGFGSRLEKSVALALEASVERDWRPEGLALVIRVPLKNLAG